MTIIRICHEENLFPFASFRNKRISQPSTKLYSWTRDGHSKPAYLRDLIWKHVWQPDYNKQSAVFYQAVVLVEFLNIKHHVPGSTILIVLPINKSHRVTKTYSSLVVFLTIAYQKYQIRIILIFILFYFRGRYFWTIKYRDNFYYNGYTRLQK